MNSPVVGGVIMKSPTPMNQRAVTVSDIPGLAMILIVAAITLGLGVLVLADFKGGIDDADANLTVDYGIAGLKELGSWMDTIAVVIAAVIILGLIFLLFRSGRI